MAPLTSKVKLNLDTSPQLSIHAGNNCYSYSSPAITCNHMFHYWYNIEQTVCIGMTHT